MADPLHGPNAPLLRTRGDDSDRVTLFAKATAALLDRGQSAEAANRQLQELWNLLEALL